MSREKKNRYPDVDLTNLFGLLPPRHQSRILKKMNRLRAEMEGIIAQEMLKWGQLSEKDLHVLPKPDDAGQ